MGYTRQGQRGKLHFKDTKGEVMRAHLIATLAVLSGAVAGPGQAQGPAFYPDVPEAHQACPSCEKPVISKLKTPGPRVCMPKLHPSAPCRPKLPPPCICMPRLPPPCVCMPKLHPS